MSKLYKTVICFLIFSCLFLRCYRIKADAPLSFEHTFTDEGWKVFNARNLAIFDRPTLGSQTPWGVIYTPLFTGVYHFALKFFGVGIKTGRFFSVFICFCTTLVFYLTAKMLTPHSKTAQSKAPLLATLLFVSDFSYFIYSRMAMPEVLCVFLTIMSIFIYLKCKDKKPVFHFLFGIFLILLPMAKPTLFLFFVVFLVLEIRCGKGIPFVIGFFSIPVFCFFAVSSNKESLALFQKRLKYLLLFLQPEYYMKRLIFIGNMKIFNILNQLSTWVCIGFTVEYSGAAMFIAPFLYIRKNISLKGSKGEKYCILRLIFYGLSFCILLIFLFFHSKKWYLIILMPVSYLMGTFVIDEILENRVPNNLLEWKNIPYLVGGLFIFCSALFPLTHYKEVGGRSFRAFFIDVPLVSQAIINASMKVFGKYDWWWHSRYFTLSLFFSCFFIFILIVLKKTLENRFFPLKLATEKKSHKNSFGWVFLMVLLVLHFGINTSRYYKWARSAKDYTYNAGKLIEYVIPKNSIVYGASFLSLSSHSKMLYRDCSLKDFKRADYIILDSACRGERYFNLMEEVAIFPVMGNRIMKLFRVKKWRISQKESKLLYNFLRPLSF